MQAEDSDWNGGPSPDAHLLQPFLGHVGVVGRVVEHVVEVEFRSQPLYLLLKPRSPRQTGAKRHGPLTHLQGLYAEGEVALLHVPLELGGFKPADLLAESQDRKRERQVLLVPQDVANEPAERKSRYRARGFAAAAVYLIMQYGWRVSCRYSSILVALVGHTQLGLFQVLPETQSSNCSSMVLLRFEYSRSESDLHEDGTLPIGSIPAISTMWT